MSTKVERLMTAVAEVKAALADFTDDELRDLYAEATAELQARGLR